MRDDFPPCELEARRVPPMACIIHAIGARRRQASCHARQRGGGTPLHMSGHPTPEGCAFQKISQKSPVATSGRDQGW